MSTKHQVHDGALAISRGGAGRAKLAAAGVAALIAIVLMAGALALEGPPSLWAQEEAGCATIDLGTLGSETGSELQVAGRWTTEGCDSRFLTNSDALTYRFRLTGEGKVRFDLTSEDGDAFLHLLAEDGSRLAHDDDTGPNLDSRIEFNLSTGVYLVEAASGSGRARGPADFALSIRRATNCESTNLGSLTPDAGLTAKGAWTLDDCGARFREDTPAHTYRFVLPQEGLVRIDLTAPAGGDPYLYLLSQNGNYIYSDDDGGALRNSRIENELAAGVYLIEATTFGDRDHAHELTDFTLTVQLVDDDTFRIKAEALQLPDEVVAGEPFTVNYRVGNAGRTDLPAGHNAQVLLVGRRIFEGTGRIAASNGRWQASASYHSGEQAESGTSTSIGEVGPFEVTIHGPGYSWLVLAVVTYDENSEEVAFHSISREFTVLSSRTFGPVTVEVDDLDYEVVAEADGEGIVTTTVSSVADPSADVDSSVRAKAIYAAGVRTYVLDGIFERPGIAGLTAAEETTAVRVDSPSSTTLLTAFAGRYASAVSASGLADVLARAEVINPATVEEIMLSISGTASAQYGSLSASWTSLQEQIDGGAALSFAEAFALQSKLAYAERVLAPAIKAGEAVEASREAEDGWEDGDVQTMVAELAGRASCDDAAEVLRDALETAGTTDVDDLLAFDTELRAALPVFGAANDSALCAAAAVDATNSQFLRSLSIAGSADLRDLVAPESPPSPYNLRIIARVLDDGRIEHGVELANGLQVLPSVRYLATNAAVDQWRTSSSIEVSGSEIGKTRVRRLADGRVELGFWTADGEEIEPEVRYLPADSPADVWLRSSEIEVLLE